MIVAGSKDEYVVIMGDSNTSEALIKMKRSAAIYLHDRLGVLLKKSDDEETAAWEEEKIKRANQVLTGDNNDKTIIQ